MKVYHTIGILWPLLATTALPAILPSPSDMLVYLANSQTVIGAIYTASTILKGLAKLIGSFRQASRSFWLQVRGKAPVCDIHDESAGEEAH